MEFIEEQLARLWKTPKVSDTELTDEAEPASVARLVFTLPDLESRVEVLEIGVT